MTVQAFKNNSDVRVINKSLSTHGTYNNVFLKDKNNISNIELTLGYSANLLTTNYVYVQELARYYFVTDINIDNNNMVTLSCKCDVLYTYKTQILNMSVIANTASDKYNLKLIDSNDTLASDCLVSFRQFSTTPFNTTDYNLTNANFVLTTM